MFSGLPFFYRRKASIWGWQMGWKGTVRSIGAAVRAAERERARRQREQEKLQREYEKMEMLAQATYEVEEFNNYIETITSLHKESSQPINWQQIASSDPPIIPQRNTKHEDAAKRALETYKPGLIAKIFRTEEKKRKLLMEDIDKSKNIDENDFREVLNQYEIDQKDWEESVSLAKRIVKGEVEAQHEAIEKLDPFSEISELGSKLNANWNDNGAIDVQLHVHGDEIIPKEVKSLLKSGKLSIKKMPLGKFFELHQDYVCSSVLRLANEMFSLLPIDSIVITAFDSLLNQQTGHIEETPIVSVFIPKATLDSLNLERIDPSDSMQNFVHNMNFKKTKGFGPVEQVQMPNDE